MKQPMLNFEEVPDFMILKCKNFMDALRLCKDATAMDDKQIIMAIEERTGRTLDHGHFSACFSANSKRNWPAELVEDLEAVCGNIVPTRYLALKKDFELRPTLDAKDREIRELQAENEAIRNEQAITKKILTELGIVKA